MRFINKIQLTLAAFSLLGFASVSKACEMHQGEVAQSLALPSGSLYHLNSHWINHENKIFHLKNFVGKPRLIAMVYTKCQTACPLLVADIKSITARIPKAQADKLNVELFSFDSESENPESLQAFKVKYKLNDRWSAYSSSKENVAELAAALGIQYKKLPSGDYIHSNLVFFINEKGEVIAKQEGLGRSVDEFIKKIQNAL